MAKIAISKTSPWLRFAAPIAVTVAMATGAADAVAATVVGSTSPTAECSGNGFSQVQSATDASTPSYTIPYDGVITSWTAPGRSGFTTQLVIYKYVSGSTYTVEALSAAEQFTGATQTLQTWKTRVSVSKGEQLGESGNVCAFTGVAGDVAPYNNTPAPSSGDETFTHSGPGRSDISAVLERDADRDGFGDESQDACPSDPTTHGACTADLAITKKARRKSVRVGRKLTYTIKVRNRSRYNVAKAVTVTDSLSGKVTFVSSHSSRGTCSKTKCSLGDVPAGKSATIKIVVRAKHKGRARDQAKASSTTADPKLANNVARLTTKVRKQKKRR